MRTDPRPEEVRELVVETLERLGVELYDWGDLDESIVIDHGRYVARSYRLEGYLAMWLVDLGLVQFYNAHGDMLATLNLFQTLEPQRMAA